VTSELEPDVKFTSGLLDNLIEKPLSSVLAKLVGPAEVDGEALGTVDGTALGPAEIDG